MRRPIYGVSGTSSLRPRRCSEKIELVSSRIHFENVLCVGVSVIRISNLLKVDVFSLLVALAQLGNVGSDA